VKKEAVMKKNLLSLNNLLLVALATLGATSPVLAATPQIPALRSFVMHPDGGVIAAEEDTGRVLLVSPSGGIRVLVSTKARLNAPSAVGIRKDFLYVQDAQAIYKVWPDLHSLTSKNASFQLVQVVSGPDQPFVKLTSPSAEDRFSQDEPVTIAWAHNLGKTARFQIELSRDNGDTWETLADYGKGNRYTWYATFPKTESARLRISQVAGPLGKSAKPSVDTTDEVFFVLNPVE
jgi:hypothetical protein